MEQPKGAISRCADWAVAILGVLAVMTLFLDPCFPITFPRLPRRKTLIP